MERKGISILLLGVAISGTIGITASVLLDKVEVPSTLTVADSSTSKTLTLSGSTNTYSGGSSENYRTSDGNYVSFLMSGLSVEANYFASLTEGGMRTVSDDLVAPVYPLSHITGFKITFVSYEEGAQFSYMLMSSDHDFEGMVYKEMCDLSSLELSTTGLSSDFNYDYFTFTNGNAKVTIDTINIYYECA